MISVKESNSKEELASILELRYEVLRKPWGQPASTATDELEETSVNAFITDENNKVIACGRLQKNGKETGQIRFMAVSPAHQGEGLGKHIVRFLEIRGKEMDLKKIELQARDNAVRFYESCGYSVKEKSFLLWGQIQHYLMEKVL
jgi:N-acetylglutamate synthase-like GNAT family acetyltransferase